MDAELNKNLFQYSLFFVGFFLCVFVFTDRYKGTRTGKKEKTKIIRELFFPLLLIGLWALVHWGTEIVIELLKPISFIVGLAMAEALGLSPILQRFLDYSVKDLDLETEEVWSELIFTKEGGIYIGFLERLLFFIALFWSKPIYIGALLTFKVAAKWETWKNIVKVPEQKPGGFTSDISYFIFKRKLGSKNLTQFLIGTFCNILFALIGYGFSEWCIKVFDP